YESGVEISNHGANPEAILTITRNDGRIIYEINGVVVRDTRNTSSPVFLTAGMYIGGDSVEDAELLGIASAVGSFPAMVGYAGDAEAEQAVGAFLPMTGESGSYNFGGATGTFLPLIGVAADAGGYALSSG